MEVKITNAKGEMVPHNTEGEICLRGYGVMKGYWDEPEKTAETLDANAWLKTGDIGLMVNCLNKYDFTLLFNHIQNEYRMNMVTFILNQELKK